MTGRLTRQGMGGFLNPPFHPEHTMSVQGRDFSMSLSAAASCMELCKNVRDRARDILEKYVPPPLQSPTIQDWIHQVLGYFRNCYSPDGVDRNCSHCIITQSDNAERPPIDHHLGVMLVRQFYPHFTPNDVHFNMAYWGKPKNYST